MTVYLLCIHRLIQFITCVDCLSLSALPADNTNLEEQGAVERCSFEQGLCSWAQSEVDTPGAEWTQHKGQEAWPNHGPPRDHTQNSAAGIKLSELLGNEIILKGIVRQKMDNILICVCSIWSLSQQLISLSWHTDRKHPKITNVTSCLFLSSKNYNTKLWISRGTLPGNQQRLQEVIFEHKFCTKIKVSVISSAALVIKQVTMLSLGLTWLRRSKHQRFSPKPYYPALIAQWV